MTSLQVCAAVIYAQDRLLLATRPPGSHLEGRWEFPGGKLQDGEGPERAIGRELREELAGTCKHEPCYLTTLTHHYPGKHIHLHFLRCKPTDAEGLHALEGQRIDWFAPHELGQLPLAPADRRFLTVAHDARLARHLSQSRWEKADSEAERRALARFLQGCAG